jgi:hypothetical protein
MSYDEIKAHMDQCGGDYRNWYVGIACDPRTRLFSQHRVCEQTGAWIYRNAGTETAARAIEKALLALGCKGGPCGGDGNTCCVYAYRITSASVEAA